MSSETVVKKNIQKLQRAIVDGLEDVKAQDIQVFNTELISPLFERVIVASGTSNRQTKALAASVRDAVREAGFEKPRTEGEENGEWIIVDCGAAVVHVMQPSIRQYYRLEDIWGEKPVRLKHGAPAKAMAAESAAAAKPGKSAKAAAKTTASREPAKKSGRVSPQEAAVKPARKTPARKSVASGAAPARSSARPAAGAAATKPRSTRKPAASVEVVKVNAPAAKKPAARKSTALAAKSAKPAVPRKTAAKPKA